MRTMSVNIREWYSMVAVVDQHALVLVHCIVVVVNDL